MVTPLLLSYVVIGFCVLVVANSHGEVPSIKFNSMMVVEGSRPSAPEKLMYFGCEPSIPIKNYLGVSHSDSGQLLLPPPTLPMVSLLGKIAAEIIGLVVTVLIIDVMFRQCLLGL
jgi:hypothetical protein